jgi:ribulose-5-phosphate 4-epimerase/fuculose-1-phosphate aldolase
MKRFEGLNRAMLEQFAPNPGRRPLLPELGLKAQVALMCRVAFREGWNEHLAGHITVRLDDGNLLTNPWELTWDEVSASDIVTVDAAGRVVDSDWNVTPAIGLHLQLHVARPDVHVVMHNHPHDSGIWASAGLAPPVYDQAGAYVPGDLPVFSEYDGTFEDRDITGGLVTALGDAKWALLAHHGALVLGKDLRQAHLRMATLEWRSMRAWQVAQLDSAAKPLAAAAIESVGLPDANGFPFLFEAMARRELRADPSVLD